MKAKFYYKRRKFNGVRHEKWLRTALKIASKNSKQKYRHCSLLVRGGKLISIGINKSKAGCLGDPCYEFKGWHSELDALIRLNPEKVKGGTLYVAGWSKGGNVICSRPCRYCQEYLKKFQLKAIYYSMPNYDYAAM